MSAQLAAHNAYKQNSVTTASPGELTLMLYNGVLKFLGKAKVAMEEKNIQEKHNNLIKAQEVIAELMATLNMDIEISNQFLPLYDYMNRRLVEANVKNDIAIIEEVEELATEFRDTWKEVLRLTRQQQYGDSNTL